MASRILSQNYLDLDQLANASVSSEQTAFPVVNAYNAQRRSKVYRSNGYFEITAANNTLQFKESGLAATLTATLTPAEFSSSSSLFAAVKAAMELVSVDTFTVSRETATNKIKIQSSGSDFEIVGGSLAPVLGFTTTPKTGVTQYVADELRIHTSEWIKWDFGISSNPDAFVLIGKRNSPIAITPSAVIKLQGNSTDVWTSPEFEEVIEYSDSICALFKAEGNDGLHTQALRFWRLLIEDKSNPNGFIEIGALFLGKYFEPTRGRIQFPFTGAYIDRSNVSFSEGGQTFSDVREQSESFDVTWSGVTTAEKEEIDYIFSQQGISNPFFIAFDPNLAFSSSDNYYTRFVKFDGAPRYQLERPNFWTVTMNLREEL